MASPSGQKTNPRTVLQRSLGIRLFFYGGKAPTRLFVALVLFSQGYLCLYLCYTFPLMRYYGGLSLSGFILGRVSYKLIKKISVGFFLKNGIIYRKPCSRQPFRCKTQQRGARVSRKYTLQQGVRYEITINCSSLLQFPGLYGALH